NDTDALVARRQTGLQEGDQDLVPFHLAREHPADVIAGLGFEPSEPQGNTVRHPITTNRKRLFEPRSVFPQLTSSPLTLSPRQSAYQTPDLRRWRSCDPVAAAQPRARRRQ